MKRVIKHIEQLLYKQECVIVPSLGAFIRHHRSASQDMGRGLIYPGKSEITFNAALSQGDGLLVQSYAEAFSFGYKRAQSLLESDVQELKSALSENGVVQIGQVGKLMQDRADGRISFIPNPDHPFSVDYYGLQPVAMLPRLRTHNDESQSLSTSRRKGDVYYLPINLRAVRYGTAAAVVAALALLIPSQKLTNPSDGKLQYQAGFLTPQKSVIETSNETKEDIPVVDFTDDSASTTRDNVSDINIVRTPVGHVRYYIVIATLSNEVQFDKYIETHSKDIESLEHLGVLVSDTYHRVFADSFETIEEAKAYLNELIKKPEFSSSWIHKTK